MILLDSDVVIAHLRRHAAAEQAMEIWVREGPLSLSTVSVAEVTSGMRSAERSSVWRLIDSLNAEPVTMDIAVRAGEFGRQYRASHGAVDVADYLIAATADVRGLELKTLNVKHFPMFKGLKPAFPLV